MHISVWPCITGQFQTEKRPESNLRRIHGLLNMLGWGILIPIGVMVARYMRKWDPLWFYMHAVTQSIGFILGLIGVMCGFVLDGRLSADVPIHKALGIVIISFGCLQVTFLFFLLILIYMVVIINTISLSYFIFSPTLFICYFIISPIKTIIIF